MKPISIRIPDELYKQVKAIVQRAWPNDTSQGQVIRRALEHYVNNADTNGKTAKLDLLLVMGEEKRVLDAELRRFVAEQFEQVNVRLDVVAGQYSEYDGCDNPPGGEG